jgi:glucose dehydrogenase
VNSADRHIQPGGLHRYHRRTGIHRRDHDSRFRAFDKDTGKELWATKLPTSAHATPMTFLGKKAGKQFVVIATGGGNEYDKTFGDALVAFALP